MPGSGGASRFSVAAPEHSDVDLLSAVSSEEIRAAQIVTGVTMAAFIAAGVIPGARRYAARIRGALLVLYLVVCGAILTHALL
jgi:hypothetical protein